MPARKPVAAKTPAAAAAFNVEAYLSSAGTARRIVRYEAGERVFVQGELAGSVLYLQRGAVKLSVLSRIGKEAVVALLGPGDFFGEGALAGQALRIATATALSATSALVIERPAMARLLSEEVTFAGRFLQYMLTRNLRIEADLVDQLFNSSEKRLARTLLLLARYGESDAPNNMLPVIS